MKKMVHGGENPFMDHFLCSLMEEGGINKKRGEG